MSKNTNIGVNVGSGWEAGGYVDASKCDLSKMGIEISVHSPCVIVRRILYPTVR